MARRSRQAPLDPGRREQDRVHHIADLHDRADTEIRSLITGADWAAWLRLAARLSGLVFTNVLLVAAQRPVATVVAGYQAWQAQGRPTSRAEVGPPCLPIIGALIPLVQRSMHYDKPIELV